jgi:predicted TIM-barrel fold metal-dependent hydrolase
MKIDCYCTIGIDREYDLTPDQLLTDMDFLQIDKAVIAPVDRCMSVYNKRGNDYILEQADKRPDRFIPGISVNPWYGEEGVEEFCRCIKAQTKILILHPLVQGYQANSNIVDGILSLAEKSSIPVYVHTGAPGNSTPWQIIDLAERFPGLDFIMGHCGATDFSNDVLVSVEQVSNVYLESSLARPFGFINYAKKVGDSRCIFGSYAPLNDMKYEWQKTEEIMSLKDWPGVYGNTLAGLLAKRGAK